MKKILQYSLAYSGMLIGILGCADFDTDPAPAGGTAGNVPVSFRLQQTWNPSRIGSTTADQVQAFVVNGNVDAGNDALLGGPLFNNTTISRENTSGSSAFTYSPTRYYPDAATQAVYAAFSPVNAASGQSFTSSNTGDDGNAGTPWPAAADNVLTYTCAAPKANEYVTVQEDLLVAAKKVASTSFGDAVSLLFYHALSRVYVSCTNNLAADATITAIKLTGVKNSGTLDIDDTNADASFKISNAYNGSPEDADDLKILWTTTAGTADYEYRLPESGVNISKGATKKVVAEEDGMMIIPQLVNLGSSTYTNLAVDITFSVPGSTGHTVTLALEDFGPIKNAPAWGFEMGRQYNLVVTLSATGGLVQAGFTVKIEQWDDAVATDSKNADGFPTVDQAAANPAKFTPVGLAADLGEISEQNQNQNLEVLVLQAPGNLENATETAGELKLGEASASTVTDGNELSPTPVTRSGSLTITWPTTTAPTLNFFAWTKESNTNPVLDLTGTGFPRLTFACTNQAYQSKLWVASVVNARANDINGNLPGSPGWQERVQLPFKQALAYIKVTASKPTEGTISIVPTQVSTSGFQTAGTLVWDDSYTGFHFAESTPAGNPANYTAIAYADGTGLATFSTDSGPYVEQDTPLLMPDWSGGLIPIVPQTTVAGAMITVKMKYKTIVSWTPITLKTDIPAGITVGPGEVMNLRINISLGSLTPLTDPLVTIPEWEVVPVQDTPYYIGNQNP